MTTTRAHRTVPRDDDGYLYLEGGLAGMVRVTDCCGYEAFENDQIETVCGNCHRRVLDAALLPPMVNGTEIG